MLYVGLICDPEDGSDLLLTVIGYILLCYRVLCALDERIRERNIQNIF
jgi:hypothetical protein